jgi:Tol biopolymer transport system component
MLNGSPLGRRPPLQTHPFRLTQPLGVRTLALVALTVTIPIVTVTSAHAAFPGTDGRIAYASYPRSLATYEEIYVVKPNGHGLTRLTNSGGSRVSNVAPDWNAAGTRIAYQHATNSSSSIRIIKPNGSVVSTVKDSDCKFGIGRPSWAPSGDAMAYQCFDGNHGNYIKTVNFTTSDVFQITSGDWDTDPEFSPAGGAIAYAHEVGGGARNEIVIAYLDIFGQFDHSEVVAGSPGEDVGSPDWNPAADALAYGCAPLSPVGDSDICTAPVAAPHTESQLASSGGNEGGPAFSPSGVSFVYAVGPDDGDTELKVRDVAGGPATTLTSNRVVDQQPDWGVN